MLDTRDLRVPLCFLKTRRSDAVQRGLFVIEGPGTDGMLSHQRSVCLAHEKFSTSTRSPIGRRLVGSEAHASKYG